MRSLQKAFIWFGRLSIVAKSWHVIQLALPFAIAGYAAIEAYSEELPRAQMIAFVMLALGGGLLALNQLRMLLGVPILVISRERFEYGLHYVGVSLAYSPNNPTAALQVVICLANSSRAPIRFKVERLDVIIGNTALPHKTFISSGGVIPLMGQRLYQDAPFSFAAIQSLIGSRQQGSVEMNLLYGPAEGPPTRRFKFKLDLSVDIDATNALVSNLLTEELDEAYIEPW